MPLQTFRQFQPIRKYYHGQTMQQALTAYRKYPNQTDDERRDLTAEVRSILLFLSLGLNLFVHV